MAELSPPPLPHAAHEADPAAAAEAPEPPRAPRPGELTGGWRLVTVVAWIAVVLGWSAVWNTSVQLGLSTWWLGPRADSTPVAVRLAPFAGPVVVILGALNNARWLPWGGLAASAVFGAYGVVDLGRVTRLGLVEVVIAVAAAMVSTASMAGMYRRATGGDPTGTDPA